MRRSRGREAGGRACAIRADIAPGARKLSKVRGPVSSGAGSVVCRVLPKRRQLRPIMQQSLSELLFPEYRRRVMGLLLLHPDEALHGREIARRTGLAA